MEHDFRRLFPDPRLSPADVIDPRLLPAPVNDPRVDGPVEVTPTFQTIEPPPVEPPDVVGSIGSNN